MSAFSSMLDAITFRPADAETIRGLRDWLTVTVRHDRDG